MTQYAKCPFCGGQDAEQINFTWWGGLVGPRMFHLVKCIECGKQYNGQNGKDASTGILIYTLVGIALGVLVLIGIIAAQLL